METQMSEPTHIPETMKAIGIEGGQGPAEALKLVTLPTPKPGPGQILVRVAAAGVNKPDLLQREGRYPPPPGTPETLGLEIAGEVSALGEGASRWSVGDSVCALLLGGGYAEYAVVDARHALPVPAGLTMAQAAGLPETVFTVFANVFERGNLKAGETLLIHGGTSGIGVTTIALAKALGARVITTSRGADKARQALELGSDLAIDSTSEDFVEMVKGDGGADVVLDMVGGDYVQKNLDVLKPDGRLSQIAFLSGAEVKLSLTQFLLKRLTFTGSTLRARSNDEKARLAAAVESVVWPWIESGQVRIPVDNEFPLAQAAAAHKYLESGAHVGKVILKI
jgi:NADPH2:quinone reductase